ncbi:MAG: iron-containing alcohol dehydrogenase family protein [Promethearchaeota archaeon]
MSLNKIRIPIIFHGENSLRELKKVTETKVLIITDRVVKNLFGEQITRFLKKKELIFFDEVEPDPKDKVILKGKDLVIEFKPDLIIGFGGGSVLDVAKMMYFLYESERNSIYECNPITSYNLGQKSRLILIPTTSGTGAEHTPAAIITNSETGQKIPIASQEIIPHTVILDPKLSLKMPKNLTASTGLDALVHAIEGMTSNLRSEFSDAANLHAIRLIGQFLPVILENDSDNIKIREKLHNAASLAGIGMANSSCGLAHACGHALGAIYHIPHGITVGIMLPYTIEFNREKNSESYIEILKTINILKFEDPAASLAKFLRDFMCKIEIPSSLKEIINDKDEWSRNLEQVALLAKKDILTPFNPRALDENDFKKIFEYAYIGKPIDF